MKPVLNALLLASLSLLAACQTMTPAERRAADEAKCTDYGFRRGSEAFAECLQRIELDRRAEARADTIRADRMMWQPPVIVERRVIVRQP